MTTRAQVATVLLALLAAGGVAIGSSSFKGEAESGGTRAERARPGAAPWQEGDRTTVQFGRFRFDPVAFFKSHTFEFTTALAGGSDLRHRDNECVDSEPEMGSKESCTCGEKTGDSPK